MWSDLFANEEKTEVNVQPFLEVILIWWRIKIWGDDATDTDQCENTVVLELILNVGKNKFI